MYSQIPLGRGQPHLPREMDCLNISPVELGGFLVCDK